MSGCRWPEDGNELQLEKINFKGYSFELVSVSPQAINVKGSGRANLRLCLPIDVQR